MSVRLSVCHVRGFVETNKLQFFRRPVALLFRSSYMLTILKCILVMTLHRPVMIYLLLSIDYTNKVVCEWSVRPTWQLTVAVQNVLRVEFVVTD